MTSGLWTRFTDKLDLSLGTILAYVGPAAAFARRNLCWIVLACLCVALIVRFTVLKASTRSGGDRERARLWMRESATRVKEAVARAKTDPVLAHQHVTEAQMAATMAREFENDPAELSKAVGVDYVDFLSYLGKVAQGVREHLARP